MKSTLNILSFEKITSTNDEAKKLLQKTKLPDFTVIFTKQQSKGRGQRENIWYSEPNKNLLFSIIAYPKNLKAKNQFYLSKVISLGIVNYLNSKTEGFKIKWPNDIYFREKKICGVLIENSVSAYDIKNSIIGIGLNINQKKFPDYLPQADSLINITSEVYNLEKELNAILKHILISYKNLKPENFYKIDKEYFSKLYKINELSEFRDKNGNFSGIIKGTLPEGKLIIETSNSGIRYYDFKEIEFINRTS